MARVEAGAPARDPALPAGCGGRPAWSCRASRPPASPRLRLLDRVRQALRARHLSARTEEAYEVWIRRFILFHGKRHPAEMGAPALTAFLTSLAVSGRVAASTKNQALSALLFRYRNVLESALPCWLKRAGPHTLRRSFATHRLEDGYDIRSVSTTIYTDLHPRAEPRPGRRPEPGRPDARAMTTPRGVSGQVRRGRPAAFCRPSRSGPRAAGPGNVLKHKAKARQRPLC
jgi:hypothetical protein